MIAAHCWRTIGTSGDRSCPELAHHIHCRNCGAFAIGAASLFDRPAPSDYIEDWTRWLTDETDERFDDDGTSICVFRLCAELFGLPTATLAGGAALRPWRRLPHRRTSGLLGLVNVGGDLMPCVSLHALLEAGESPDAAKAQRGGLLIGGDSGQRFAFPVDEIVGIQRFPSARMHRPPATVARSSAALTSSLCETEPGTVAILDAQRLRQRIEDLLT
ncbi:MAG: chemotaxis protein CheW [Methylotetracoccus sp.]